MNRALFSDAMSELNEKYIVEAATFQNKRKLVVYRKKPRNANSMLHHLKQAVAAVLLIGIISFGGIMTVEAYRERIVEAIVQVFHELTDFRFASNGPSIDKLYLPELNFGYIPEGMLEIDNRETGNKRRFVLYQDSSGNFFELTQRPIGNNGDYGTILDTEDAVSGSTAVNGYDAVYNTKDGESVISWINGSILYRLHGNMDLSVLHTIAEGIQISGK